MRLNLSAQRAAWILWGSVLAVVIAGSLTPRAWVQDMGLPTSGLGDKLFHFSGYCLLAVLPALRPSSLWSKFFFAAAMLTLGIMLELTQIIVPGRALFTNQ